MHYADIAALYSWILPLKSITSKMTGNFSSSYNQLAQLDTVKHINTPDSLTTLLQTPM